MDNVNYPLDNYTLDNAIRFAEIYLLWIVSYPLDTDISILRTTWPWMIHVISFQCKHKIIRLASNGNVGKEMTIAP